MSARILDGAAVAAAIRERVATEVRELAGRGVTPRLEVILVGDGKFDGMAAKEADARFLFVQSNDDLKRVWARLKDPAFDVVALKSDSV